MNHQPSIVIFEQPIKRLHITDWHGRLQNQTAIAENQRDTSFEIRQQSRTLRNEVDIKTAWDAEKNTSFLSDRVTELRNWIALLETTVRSIEADTNCLANEKHLTEHDIRVLDDHIGVLNECFSIRDLRRKPEATHDDVEVQLRKELCKIEDVKKLLIDHCENCYTHMIRLQDMKCQLILDIEDKIEATCIDDEVRSLNRKRGDISYKFDILEPAKHSTTYEVWLQHSRNLKQAADMIIAESPKVREAIYMAREYAKNEALAERELTDFTLRKRIYDSERAKNELNWQKQKMQDEMTSLLQEIERLEENFNEKNKDLKCVESRLSERKYRPNLERAYDQSEISLIREITDLRQSRQNLDDQIRKAKTMYNALEDMKWKIDQDFNNKNHSLMTDIRCLDTHLRIKTPMVDTQTNRNIQLTQMQKQIAPN